MCSGIAIYKLRKEETVPLLPVQQLCGTGVREVRWPVPVIYSSIQNQNEGNVLQIN
jgi:hypothetical protein